MNKKIVHIVEGFGGGVYTFLVDLCNELAVDNEVILIYSIREQTPKDYEYDFSKNIKLIKLDMAREVSPIKDFKNTVQLIKILKKENPDIVHLHSSKAGVLGRIAGKIAGFSGNMFYNPHGYSFLQLNISKVKRKIYWSIEKLMSKVGGRIIAVSNGEYIESLKLSKNSIRIDNSINNIELDKYIVKKNKKEKLNIGTLGRITYQKNPKLFNEIAKKFPQLTFRWIGDGELRADLTSSNISIMGWMERNEAITEMNDIDIYLQTSLWEGLPIALLEAMYMGKNVVVSNVIGNNDVVNNYENGFIANELDDYVEIINNIISNNELFECISIKSKEYIIENHLLYDMFKKYKNVYEIY